VNRVDVGEAVTRVHHEEWARVVASLTRRFGDLDIAEDAAAEAFATAVERWPADGIPPNPGGWLTTTATRKAIDRIRRESKRADKHKEAGMAYDDPPEPLGVIGDERLRLIFTCAHPALSMEARVALTLRLVGGLTVAEIARAFLVQESAVGRRITRAKAKIKAARIPYRAPADHELPTRLPPVLAVIYLVYNAGLARTAEPSLCDEAIRLARLLVTLMPDEPEVAGLLALLLLAESRRASRIRPDGSLALLAEQDRGGWDRALIDEGRAVVRQCLRRGQLGRYQLQAAISAEHANAATIAETNWPEIVALYDRLLAIAPTPVVALNRAIAIGEVEGPAAALALVDHLGLEGYYPFHATRGDLLQRLGREREAAAAFARAAALAPTDAEREFLERGGRAPSPGSPQRCLKLATGPVKRSRPGRQ